MRKNQQYPGAQQIDQWPIEKLIPYAQNPRTHSDAQVMAGDAVDLVFTDPPYNVDYEGYTEERLKLKGDRMSATEFKQFLEASFRSYRATVVLIVNVAIVVYLAARVRKTR